MQIKNSYEFLHVNKILIENCLLLPMDKTSMTNPKRINIYLQKRRGLTTRCCNQNINWSTGLAIITNTTANDAPCGQRVPFHYWQFIDDDSIDGLSK